MQAVHQPANRDMLAERVELLQRDLVTLASKMRAAGERPLDLSQAESLSKLMYSRLIEFSKFARDLPSEKEESISGWARQKLMLKGLGRHKKILLGQLSSSKIDQRFNPDYLLDWVRVKYYMNTIDVSQMGLFDPITRNRIRKINREYLQTLRMAEPNQNPIQTMLAIGFEEHKDVKSFPILLDGLEMGVFEYRHVRMILQRMVEQRTYTLLSPQERNRRGESSGTRPPSGMHLSGNSGDQVGDDGNDNSRLAGGDNGKGNLGLTVETEKDMNAVKHYLKLLMHLILLHNDSVFENLAVQEVDGKAQNQQCYFFQSKPEMELLKLLLLDPLIENRYFLVKELEDPECKQLYYNIFLMLMSYHYDPMVKSIQTLESPGYELIPPAVYDLIELNQSISERSEKLNVSELLKVEQYTASTKDRPDDIAKIRSQAFYTAKQMVFKFKQEFKFILEGNYISAKGAASTPKRTDYMISDNYRPPSLGKADEELKSFEKSLDGQSGDNQAHTILLSNLSKTVDTLWSYLRAAQSHKSSVIDIFLESLSHHGLTHVLLLHASYLTSDWSRKGYRELVTEILRLLGTFYQLYLPGRGHLFTFDKWDSLKRVAQFAPIETMCLLVKVVDNYQEILINSHMVNQLLEYLIGEFHRLMENSEGLTLEPTNAEVGPPVRFEHPKADRIATLNIILSIFSLLLETTESNYKDQQGLIKKLAIQIQNILIGYIDYLVLPKLSNPKCFEAMRDFSHPVLHQTGTEIAAYYQETSIDRTEYEESWLFVFLVLKTFNKTCKHSNINLKSTPAELGIMTDLDRVRTYFVVPGQQERASGLMMLLQQQEPQTSEPSEPVFLQKFSPLVQSIAGAFFFAELVQLYSFYNVSNISQLSQGLELPTNEVIFNYYRIGAEVLNGVLSIHRDIPEKYTREEGSSMEASDKQQKFAKKALCYLLCKGQLEPAFKFIKGASLHLTIEQLKTSTLVSQICRVLSENSYQSHIHKVYLKDFSERYVLAAKELGLNIENQILKSASTFMMNLDKSPDASSDSKAQESSQQGKEIRPNQDNRRGSMFHRLKVKQQLSRTFDANEKDTLLVLLDKMLDLLREASQKIYESKEISLEPPEMTYSHYEKETYADLRLRPSSNWLDFSTEGNWNLEDLKGMINENFERYCQTESDEDLATHYDVLNEIKQSVKYPVEKMADGYLNSKKAQIKRDASDKKKQAKSQEKESNNKMKDQAPKSVYAELSESTEDNPQAYYLIIAYWVMKDLHSLFLHTFSKRSQDWKQIGPGAGIPANINKQDVLFTQPALVGMLELFDNVLIIGGRNVRKLVYNMFFESDEEDETEIPETNNQPKKYDFQRIGRLGLKFVMQMCLCLQRTIVKETFDLHELTYSGLYFRLSFLLKSLVEENFIPMKHIMRTLKLEETSKVAIENENMLEAYMGGISLPAAISEEVSVNYFQSHDRPDLVWYNYVTIVTLSECVFGIPDAVKVTSQQIIAMLKQLNTICIDVNNPIVFVKERLAVLVGFLFEGSDKILKDLYDNDPLGEMIKPRIMFQQIVQLISLLLFSRDEICQIENQEEEEDEREHELGQEKRKEMFDSVLEVTRPKPKLLIPEEIYQHKVRFTLVEAKIAKKNDSSNQSSENKQNTEEQQGSNQKQVLEQFCSNYMQKKFANKIRMTNKITNAKGFKSNAILDEFKKYNLLDEFSSPKDILSECYIPRPEIAKHRLLSAARMIYSIMKLISKSALSREYKVFLTYTEYNVAEASGDTATLSLYQSNTSLMQDFMVFRSSQDQKPQETQPGVLATLFSLFFPRKDWSRESVVFGFLKLVSGSVEVRTESSNTTLVDFPILPCCFFISEQTKLDFTESVTIGDHGGRLVDMMESVSHFEIEASLNMSIHQTSPFLERIVSLDSFKRMMWFSWIVSSALNIIALIFLDFSKYIDRSYQFEDEWYWTVLNIGNIFLIVYSLFMGCIYLIVRSTENYQKRTNRIFEVISKSRHSLIRRIFLYVWEILKDVLMNQDVIVFSCYTILFSALFLLDSSYYLPFHTLLFASLSKTAKYIIRSITLHVDQLLFTLLLVMIVVYSYTMLIGLYYQNSFDPGSTNDIPVCNNLINCYCYVLDLGLRNGGGVGDAMVNVPFGNGYFYGKFFMTVTFFIFVNLVSLNIIFGIIIDTFAELRKELEEREDEDYRACFICGMERKDFEKKDKSFDYHKAVEHSLWNYVYFIIYLNHQPKLDMTGVESHVFNKLESKSPEWIPRNATVFLHEATDEDVSLMEKAVKELTDKMESVKRRTSTLENALKQITKRDKDPQQDHNTGSPLKQNGESNNHEKMFQVELAAQLTSLRSLVQLKTGGTKSKLDTSAVKHQSLQQEISQRISEISKEPVKLKA